jgi:CRISPR system Cascade subunit CasD
MGARAGARMKAILLRFDAPLVSFGGPAVDHNRVVQPYPALSMLTGLIANALGWDHRDYEALGSLQERLRYAARIDRPGAALVDYQTVDLGKDWMLPKKAGWTTRGRIAERAGASGEATHQRYTHYRADSIHTVALALVGEQAPTLEDVAFALREPARPLFIGRKCCLPAGPVLLGVVETDSLVSALATTPRAGRADRGLLQAWWWDGDDGRAASGESRVVPPTDERDWLGGVHVGRRLMREGHVDPPESSHA